MSILRHLGLPLLLMGLTIVPVRAATEVLDLHILNEGRVRIGDGPVMNMRQFRVRLEDMKKQRQPPDLVTRTESDIAFGAVLVVMQTLRDADYDAHVKVPEPAQEH